MVVLAGYLLLNRNPESNDIQALNYVLILLGLPTIIFCNHYITKILDNRLPWVTYKERRFILQVLIGLLVSLVCITLLYIVLKKIYTDTDPDTLQLLLINIYGIALIVPVISIFFGLKFLNEWNRYKLESERLEKENARSQMMSLRNHLDPHFLFNNLNILSSLMDHDIELSQTYLVKFAEVYRTILKSELSDLTTLSEEMELIRAYIFLIQIRWKDGLDIEIKFDDKELNYALPPLSVQMLIENAIKHNVISKSSPLRIDLEISDKYLKVTNSKELKLSNKSKSGGTGLENIKNRYAYFTDIPVLIEDSEKHFSVSLPLLEVESV